MRKVLSLVLLFVVVCKATNAQNDQFWQQTEQNLGKLVLAKGATRASFPSNFKVLALNEKNLVTQLLQITEANSLAQQTLISLPNANGELETFQIFEASNFDADLQARFPEIRAFSGRGISDKYATVKLSYAPSSGIQTMVFRTGKPNEYMEPFSADKSLYAVYSGRGNNGIGSWRCSTPEQSLASGLNAQVQQSSLIGASTGKIKTMRLAQACTGEYAAFFGASNSSQVNLVLAAFNATLTRCNGVFERELALHLNLINQTTNLIFYNAATDPYSDASVGTSPLNEDNANGWNIQLQNSINNFLGTSLANSNSLYDIGHLFGGSGGGGNAGCIGCVCTNPTGNGQKQKGSGFTSPGDAIPQGDNFDIDYVAHEIGHQLGANHTYSHINERTGVNKEVGSGITIMGYAGITPQDVAPHSIEFFHQASIDQIQVNLASKTCPVSVDMTANTAPTIGALSNFTIPISTPFALTGSATDAQNDALTYCWEQNDNVGTSQTGASSVASATKASGPNWLSFAPSTSGIRYFPRLSTILAGANITGVLPGGDAGANIEALSSVSRTLNFRLTVRDNSPYQPGVKIGQTAFSDAIVTVSNSSGPFAVSAPNTAVTLSAGGTTTVTWSVNNTTAAPVSCANVKISLSTDGGQSFPTVLLASTPNDGSQLVTLPNSPSTTCRIKVEAVGNIFFDISNANFTIGAAATCGDATGLATSNITQSGATLSWLAVSGANNYTVDFKTSAATTWTSAATATTSTSQAITGLTANTTYLFRVRANCATASGNFVQAQFTTAAVASSCPGTLDVSANGTTSGAATIPFNTDVKGTISNTTDVDYYKFVITTAGTATVTLGTLPADFDLEIYSSNGTTRLAISDNANTTNETISRTYTAGTYYAKVYGYNGANSTTVCYTLRVQLGTASRNENAQQILVDNKLQVAPNPATNDAKFVFNTHASGVGQVSIINQMGSVVARQNCSIVPGYNVTNINIANLPAGIYLAKIQVGKVSSTVKLMVKK